MFFDNNFVLKELRTHFSWIQLSDAEWNEWFDMQGGEGNVEMLFRRSVVSGSGAEEMLRKLFVGS